MALTIRELTQRFKEVIPQAPRLQQSDLRLSIQLLEECNNTSIVLQPFNWLEGLKNWQWERVKSKLQAVIDSFNNLEITLPQEVTTEAARYLACDTRPADAGR